MATFVGVLHLCVILINSQHIHFRFSNSFGFVEYAPILNIASSYYNVSEGAVVWFSNSYDVVYFSFAAIFIKLL